MFREIRRTKGIIDNDAMLSLLTKERRAVLAMQGDDGYPYALPVNFYYDKENNKIYFHGLRSGYKYEAIKANDKVCFTVYGNERILDDEEWAPYMQSVVVFGRCHLIEDEAIAFEHLRQFARKYYPSEELIEEVIGRSGKAVQMYEIEIEHMSGKQVKEK